MLGWVWRSILKRSWLGWILGFSIRSYLVLFVVTCNLRAISFWIVIGSELWFFGWCLRVDTAQSRLLYSDRTQTRLIYPATSWGSIPGCGCINRSSEATISARQHVQTCKHSDLQCCSRAGFWISGVTWNSSQSKRAFEVNIHRW